MSVAGARPVDLPTRLESTLPPYVAALLRPEAYPHSADDIRLHDTHISWVVLAGQYAYKIKKPVNFGFLDFTTVEQRAAVCADEVRLNRRLSRDVYLGVVHIVERNGRFRLGGADEPGEPVVWMRRLPADGMLPALLERRAVDERLIRRIARHLARFHDRAGRGPEVDVYGSREVIQANWQENFVQTASFVGRALSVDEYAMLGAYVEQLLVERAALFERRLSAGRIREGHGDLHAASICLDGRRLVFFDCLEFSARFRCADVAAEVAFLAMDLDHFGRADLSWAFVDEYVRRTSDRELLELLDFYRCYRAYVRAKVLCLRSEGTDISGAERNRALTQASAYFDQAWSYAGGLPRPLLLLTMGLPASGKSTLAHGLASRLGLVQLSSDLVRKELAGTRPTERHAVAFSSGIYDARMTRRTYATLRRRAARWLRRGRSVVVDATFARRAERAAMVRLARQLGVPLLVLVCRAADETLRKRLAARATDPTAVSDARTELWPALKAAFEPPDELADVIVINAEAAPELVVERAVEALSNAVARAGADQGASASLAG